MNPKFLSSISQILNPMIAMLPNRQLVKIDSWARRQFMHQFVSHLNFETYNPPEEYATTLWGIKFRSAIGNSAGMFKNGEGYDVVAKLGAGAYIGGTSTASPRLGNTKDSIYLPFTRLPNSGSAINYLGLPNYGDNTLSKHQITKNKIEGCPIGWSVMRSPDYSETDGLAKLIESLWLYHDHPQIDFLEINESCPNIKLSGTSIIPRLEFIAREFLAHRIRNLPVIIKLSTDLNSDSLKTIMEKLISLKFDGINLGNTSTDYSKIRALIANDELKLFDYFTNKFGGGVSGSVLKSRSLELCSIAREHLNQIRPNHEFHIIRSGGIENFSDLAESQRHGISFNQWYTGFFHKYNQHGDKVYQKLFDKV